MKFNACAIIIALFALSLAAPLAQQHAATHEVETTKETKATTDKPKTSKFRKFADILGAGASGAIILNTANTLFGSKD